MQYISQSTGKFKPCILIGCLLIFLLMEVKGQNVTYFNTLTTQNGLPSNVISAIAQDKHGFIWIGTVNGVARYDGKSFQNFRKEEYPHLTANEISSLLAVDDEIWIGTWKGLCKINIHTKKISSIDLGISLAIRALYIDPRGMIWIGSNVGLFQFNGTTFRKWDSENSKLSHNLVRTIYMDQWDNLWVGTYDKLNKLTKEGRYFESFDLKGTYKPALKNNLILDIQEDTTSPQHLWIGTETGLIKLHIPSGTFQTFNETNTQFSNEVIKSIYSASDELLILGTDFGVNFFSKQDYTTKSTFNHPELAYSIGSNVNMQIFEDTGGVIWFVTSNGLSLVNKYNEFYQFIEVSHKQGNQKIGSQVKSILHSKNGDIWLATLNGVIKIGAEGTEETFDILSSPNKQLLLNNVYALEEDDYGRIWIGTAGGINIWDPASKQMTSISSDNTNGLGSNYIAHFVKSADGSFWVSAWEGGIFKVRGDIQNLENISFEKASEYGSEKVTFGANALWALNYDELVRIDLQTYRNTTVTSFNQISSRRSLNALHFSKKGTLWVATTNGLIEYQPQLDQAKFHPITIGSEFLFNSITEDESGNIWGAASGFLCRFKVEDGTFVLFPLDSGLPLKSFFENSYSKDSDGAIYFGGDNGFIQLNSEAKPNFFTPPIFLSNLQINNEKIIPSKNGENPLTLEKDIAFLDQLVLNYHQRSFSVDLVSLHYWQPEKTIYAYMLDGYDNDWKYTSGISNTVVYSKLPTGSNQLRVKASNNYGIWSDEVTSLAIIVKPPLFLSNLFIAIYIILGFIFIVLVFRFYSQRLNLKNEVKLAVLEKQYTEEITKTKTQFFTNISHELRTPISLILPPIQQTLENAQLDEKSRELLTLAQKNSNRLLQLVNQILDFRKLEQDKLELKVQAFDLIEFSKDVCGLFNDRAARSDIQLKFNSELDSCTIWADQEKIETVLYNLLSNAFKFTPNHGTIELLIKNHPENPQFRNGAVDIQVHDTGEGIEASELDKIFERFYQGKNRKTAEAGSGIGLSMVKEYTKLHFGQVTVESQPNEGTVFTVTLPLGSVHLPMEIDQQNTPLNLIVSKVENEEDYAYDLDSSKPVVMLVEDYPDMVDYLFLHLKENYHLITAQNGQEALEKIKSFTPEVIISDIMMPIMDGLTLCQKIKQNPKTSHIGVVLLTAKSLTSQKVAGIKAGADAYLTKPFDLELLKANIEQLIKRKDILLNYFKAEIITQPEFKDSGDSMDDKFIKKVVGIIEANISNPHFTVELLCEEIGISTAHLYRKLKALTHYSAKEIIRKYRLKKASILLKNKEGNISEIMYEVGFSNLSYFAKCFKKEYGVSPREYQTDHENITVENLPLND